MIGLLLMLAPLPPQGAIDTQISQVSGWSECVLTAARKWAKNNEAANVIADGAFGACYAKEPINSPSIDSLRRHMREMAIATILDRRIP